MRGCLSVYFVIGTACAVEDDSSDARRSFPAVNQIDQPWTSSSAKGRRHILSHFVVDRLFFGCGAFSVGSIYEAVRLTLRSYDAQSVERNSPSLLVARQASARVAIGSSRSEPPTSQ